MAYEVTISGVTHGTAGTPSSHTHNLGLVPDAVMIAPMIGRGSGTVALGSTTPANASVFTAVGTLGSLAFKATVIKFHSIQATL